MTQMAVASHAAERLRAWTPRAEDHAYLESVEVVLVDGSVGLDLRWTQATVDQGHRRFGLLTTVEELLQDADTDSMEWVVEALLIAIQEPHAAPRKDMRLVFRHLP
jgi:hypothetical protein